MDFQNSADAPLGMTAMRVVLVLAELLLHARGDRDSARHADVNVRLCIVNTQYHGRIASIQCREMDILELAPTHSSTICDEVNDRRKPPSRHGRQGIWGIQSSWRSWRLGCSWAFSLVKPRCRAGVPCRIADRRTACR